MDEKSKRKKKLKQKQKQRQKQNQTVIVNVHSGKSSKSQSKPDKPRVQIPPPIHKVYASPIHDLVPQMFNREGRQATQQTLSQQIEKILQNQEQSRQGNVLGSPPLANIAPAQTASAKKAVRIPLRPNLQPDEQLVLYDPSDTDAGTAQPVVRRKPGPKKGSKNKPTPKVNAMEVVNSAGVMGVAEVIAEPAFSEKKYIPDQLPDEFMREQWLLRPSQNPDNMFNINRYQTLFDNPQPPEQPLGAIPTKKIKGKKGKTKNLTIEEEEIDEL
jgi:hypothetical protein